MPRWARNINYQTSYTKSYHVALLMGEVILSCDWPLGLDWVWSHPAIVYCSIHVYLMSVVCTTSAHNKCAEVCRHLLCNSLAPLKPVNLICQLFRLHRETIHAGCARCSPKFHILTSLPFYSHVRPRGVQLLHYSWEHDTSPIIVTAVTSMRTRRPQ